MPNHPDNLDAPDMCLLLRAHCEQHWLESELLPVIDELEQPDSLPEEQRGAALAYLEVLWLDARMRASHTDASAARLEQAGRDSARFLADRAHRYHAAVRRQRHAIALRIDELTLSQPCDELFCELFAPHEHASS